MSEARRSGPAVEIVGLKELRKQLRDSPKELRDELKAANRAAADVVADEARRIVPVRTGRLKRSILAQASASSGRVKAGSAKKVPYAAPDHFGWPTRPNKAKRWRGGPIAPNPWLYEAQDRRIPEVYAAFEKAAARWVEQANRQQ